MKNSILYIINFYGTPPLSYFEKYIQETDNAHLTILKLPAIRSSKHRILLDAFIKDEEGKTYPMRLNFYFPLPYFLIFFIQYLINIALMFILLGKVKRTKFDIIIGETNFGSAMGFILKLLGKGSYSTFFNGDILPKPSSSKKYFFLPNSANAPSIFMKSIDTLILYIQFALRKMGYQNDLVWYCNENIKSWDKGWGLQSKDYVIVDPILIDFNEFKHYEKERKDMSALGYIGRIDDYVGLDIIIPALTKIKKKIPNIKLHIIGGSEITTEKYRKLVKKLDLTKHVQFYGYLPKAEDAFVILSRCALGMALYKPTSDNVSMIAQPAKPKEYIKASIPVLLTENGPSIGREIVAAHAGVPASFDENSVADVISRTLLDTKEYLLLQQGVKKYAEQNHYATIIAQILEDIDRRYQAKVKN